MTPAEPKRMAKHLLIAESVTPDHERLTLTLEQGQHVVRVRNEVLMSSRVSGSEETLASLALAERAPESVSRVLVGGLGMGFTLRAVLGQIGPAAKVVVSELLQTIVDWNRGPLGSYAGQPLDDPRVEILVGDVIAHLTTVKQAYDAIVLDIDNGPEAFTVAANNRLYTSSGLTTLYAALRSGGVLVLWSAFKSPRFEQRLRGAGFNAESVTVRARGNIAKGARHTVFRGVRAGG